MSAFALLGRSRSRHVLRYGSAALAVVLALVIARVLERALQSGPQVSLFLCAVMFSAWFGGLGPGLFSIVLAALAFDWFFLPPINSLTIAANQLPRLLTFLLAALFVAALSAAQQRTTELLRRAGSDLAGTVRELQRTNEALHAENAERKRAEQELTQATQLLDRRVAERTHELATLLATSNTIATTLDLQPLLHMVLEQLKVVVRYTGAVIVSLDGDELEVLGYSGPLAAEQVALPPLALANTAGWAAMRRRSRPVIIADLDTGSSGAQAFRESVPPSYHLLFAQARSLLLVPLLVRERLIGLVVIEHDAPHFYTAHDADLALAFANAAAAAIENARLYDQARALATVEERQRLARELHDAVTQTLFSASMIAEALPDAWKQSPQKAQRGVEELRRLTRGALAEMRTLLMELRPTALIEKPLVELLGALATAVMSRSRVTITLNVAGDALVAPAVQIACYRVTQEALNNVVKYAGASQVMIRGYCAPDRVELRIVDDGRGFDLEAIAPESLGLGIMRERAAEIGATLLVESRPGHGTSVTITWQSPT